jgi:hypothetical protein
VALGPRSPEFLTRVGQVSTLGDGEMRASAQAANRMLNRSVAALAGAKGDSWRAWACTSRVPRDRTGRSWWPGCTARGRSSRRRRR